MVLRKETNLRSTDTDNLKQAAFRNGLFYKIPQISINSSLCYFISYLLRVTTKEQSEDKKYSMYKLSEAANDFILWICYFVMFECCKIIKN